MPFFQQADFADNKEFITVLVYKTGGKKVFYPCECTPLVCFFNCLSFVDLTVFVVIDLLSFSPANSLR